MANLGPQLIKNSYQDLVQITASNALAKGDGTSISAINVPSITATSITASNVTSTSITSSDLNVQGIIIQGQGTNATNLFARAHGLNTIASGQFSNAEGGLSQALGTFTHAEGQGTIALGTSAHAEGIATIASGSGAHAEGGNTIARGNGSHAEGYETLAVGLNSHAEGYGTIAEGDFQHTTGQFNITSPAQSAFIIGNGADANNRSNLLFAAGSEIQITGSLKVNGSITGSLLGTSSWAQNAVSASFLTSTANTFVQGGNSFGATALLGTNDNQNLQLETSGSVRVHIGNDGNVGIGTTSPTTKLDVSGSGNFTEDVYISGSLEFKGTTDNLYIAPSTDVRNWYLSNKNFTVSQEGVPSGIYFKDDGTRFYIIGSSNDRIYQYDLSTPWDVSTAVYNSVNLSVTAQDTVPTDLFISPDGTILFVVGATNDRVYRYDLSSAWDISSATFLNFFSVSSQETEPNGLYFDPTGTNMYVVGTTGDDVNQYTLGTAWDLTTASFLQTFSVVSQETAPVAISFNNSGTRMYILGQSGDDITEYRLSTPWDISTATFFTTGFTSVESAPGGLYYNETYEVAYIVGSTNDTVYGFRTTPQLKYYGDSFIMDSQMFVGGRTEIGAPLYVNGTATATSTLATLSTLVSANSSFSTSTITLGTGTSTNVVNIGGNASLSSTNQFAYGAITSSLTKTVRIGTGGLTGSITNITIGSPLGEGKIILGQNTDFTQNATINQTLNVNNNSNILDAAQTASGAIVVYDTFTEASNTLLSSHTPNTGSGWSRVQISTFTSPTMTVFGATNTAGPTANVSNEGVIYRQDTTLTTPDYEVSVDLVTQDSADDLLWLFARYQDVDNWYGVAWSTSQASCRLVRRVGGTFTNIATPSIAPITGATTLSIRVQNNLIVVLNGGNIVMTAYDTSITDAGYAAIGGGNIGQTSTDDFDTTWKFDNFMVRNYVAGTQTSNIAGGLNITGNVGIGTTSPTAELHISGASADALLRVGSPTNDNILLVNGSGNIGIGTVSPTQRLDVRDGFIQVSGSGAAGQGITIARAGLDTYQLTHEDGGLTIRNFTDNVKEMTFLGNGNIGINKTNPSARLEIRGSGATSATTALRVENSNATASLVVRDDGNVGIGTTTPSTTLQVAGTSSLQHIIFDTNNIYDIGTSAVRARNIWSNGVVVGTTSYFTSAVMYNNARIGGEHTATALLHISGSNSAQMMRINSPTNANILFVSGSGNVGIGTSNPLSLLHISASSGNEFLRITSGSQNILNVRSNSAVFFAGTGVAPTSNFDLDIQGTGTANGGSVRIAGNSTEWRFGSVSSVNRGGTGNPDMFNVTMGGTSATLVQNPMKIQFDASQNPTSGSGYTVLRVNATHATTAGTGSKLLQTWEFAGVQRSVVNITGSIGVGITAPSASVHISSSLGLAPILAITPHHPLPTTNIPTGSFMVSSSIPPKPFFWDGTTWNALY